MSTKRSRSDFDAEDRASPAPNGESSSKRRKPDGEGKGKAKRGSTVWSRKRIRAIERLLQRDQGMPQDARNTLERELAGLRSNIADNSFQRKRSEMISKYHMVRFFERKKAMRLAKQLRRQIEKCDDADEKKQLERDLHVAEVDETYAQHFPHAETYISLYRNGKADDKEDSDDVEPTTTAKDSLSTERPPMWKTIEKAMRDGPQALTRLRERRPQDSSKPAPQKAQKPVKPTAAKDETGLAAFKNRPTASTASTPTGTNANGQPQLNRRERRKLMHKNQPVAQESDGEEDGGGFLEI